MKRLIPLALLACAGALAARAASTITLVQSNAYWHYWDRGSEPADWRELGYTGEWPHGQAPLGYEQGDENTVVSYGPDPGNRYITTYFRRPFFVPDPSLCTNLVLRVRRDDGIAVYLNGMEIFRNNLPAGPLAFGTLAANAEDDGALWLSTNVSPALLYEFENNVIAAEVHQRNGVSSDLTFDLELIAEVTSPPGPALRIDRADPVAVVSWPTNENSYVLQRTAVLGEAWTGAPFAVTENAGRWQAVVNLASAQEFFRLSPATSSPPCQPALIKAQPKVVFASVGAPVTLSVTAAGTTPFTYDWRKNFRNHALNAGSSITIPNAQPSDGGRYDVLIGNECSCVFCLPIVLIVGGENLALADNFADRGLLPGGSFAVNVTNVALATAEASEPQNPYRHFGRTLWARWVAPAAGYATFDTIGSGPEPAIAVYSGTNLANLVLEASGGESVTFNATNGQEFQIQLDSASPIGPLRLNGMFTTSALPAPQIVLQPEPVYVTPGSNASMAVVFSGAPGAVQWFKDGVAVTNATNAILNFAPVQTNSAGSYRIVATLNSVNVTSGPASLVFADVSAPGSGSVSPLASDFGGVQTFCGKKFTKHLQLQFRVPGPADSQCALIGPVGSYVADPHAQPCLDNSGTYSPVYIDMTTCVTGGSLLPPTTTTLHTVDQANTGVDTGLIVYRMKDLNAYCGTVAWKCATTDASAITGIQVSAQVNYTGCSPGLKFLKVFLLYKGTATPTSIKLHYQYCP